MDQSEFTFLLNKALAKIANTFLLPDYQEKQIYKNGKENIEYEKYKIWKTENHQNRNRR